MDEFCNKSDISRVKQRILKYGIISPELLNVYLAEGPCPPDRTKIVFYAKKKMQLKVKVKIQLRITPKIPEFSFDSLCRPDEPQLSLVN